MKSSAGQRRPFARRRMAALLACGLPLLALAPVPGSSTEDGLPLDPEEREWLARHPVVRYGADPAWPPFSMRTGDSLVGIDRNLIDDLGSRLGVVFEYLPTRSWEETVEKLRSGEIDFVTGVADLPERSLDLLFTSPYSSFPVAMIMRKDGPFFTSLERVEREGLVIAGPSGYAPTVFVERNHPSIRLLAARTSLDALRKVSDGEADAVVENLGVAAHLIRLHGLSNLKITGPTYHRFDPAIGVRGDLPLLRSVLDKGIAAMTPQDRLRIYGEWVPLEISRLWSWRRVALIGAVLGLAAAAVLGAVAAWNRRLGQELAKRREVEASLRRSEERFRHLFESMEEAYLLTQPNGMIQFVNEAAVALLRIGSRPVAVRLGLPDFLSEPAEFGHLLERLRESERLRDCRIDISAADGALQRCLCQVRLVRDAAGDEVGIEWIVRFSGAEASPRPDPA